jgi:methionyl-tRNA synthetase
VLSAPFLPFSAERVWRMLGLGGSVFDEKWDDAGELDVREGHVIGKVELLYRKIEDAEIGIFDKKYLKKEEKNMDPYVELADFERVGLRIGEIKEVDDHPKADKLYLLKVDLGGGDVRQVVAGIKAAYPKDALLGRKVVVATNLKPAEIRGEKSYGMILAADVGGQAVLLAPEKSVPTGSVVR